MTIFRSFSNAYKVKAFLYIRSKQKPMNPLLAEFLGTMILIIMGVGVCASNALQNSFAKGTGWVLIAFGWGIGVFLGVVVAGPHSGGHLNPAVTIGLALAGKFPWSDVFSFSMMQLLGALTGAALTWFQFSDHYNQTEDAGAIKGTFCTGPAIKNTTKNVYSEVLGTFILVFVVLMFSDPSLSLADGSEGKVGLGSIGALPVALLVVGIGMSLGSTTGYAINPARDLGPRIWHALAPIKHKGKSDWGYSWVPIIGPIIGGALAASLYQFII